MKPVFTTLLLLFALNIGAQKVSETQLDIPYYPAGEQDSYRRERCKLDVYCPSEVKDSTVVVWFHGGGLTGGEKSTPETLREMGVIVVAVNYRLSPRANHPAYIEDAALSLKWTMDNIAAYGGSKKNIYVSGHSAGGYLALMLALDDTYLKALGESPDDVVAWFPLSGQTLTHYTIRKEQKLPDDTPSIDKYAPLAHPKAQTSPIFLITGDRDMELTGRYEENALLDAVLKGVGNKQVYLYELRGFDHGNMYLPGCTMMAEYIKKQWREKK